MDLFEVEGKLLFKQYDIPCEDAAVGVKRPEQYPVVVKGQYLSGKRGKAGAIRVVHDEQEYRDAVECISKIAINGSLPSGIHCAPFIHVEKEYYLGITLDRKARSFVLLFSKEGGMDIESIAEKGLLYRAEINDGNAWNVITEACEGDGLLCDIAEKLWRLVRERDCLTAEINPLGLLADGSYYAMDSKIVIDDNAWYRQKDKVQLLFERKKEKTPYEEEAEKYGLSFVNLNSDGNVGVIAGGAGIGMATVDSLNQYGLKPFNFCDLGGGVSAEKTYHAVRLLLDVPELKGILINVFGGINNCFDMALGITRALDEKPYDKKIVVKSRGYNQEDGWKLYDERMISQVHYGTTDDAVIKLKKLLEESL